MERQLSLNLNLNNMFIGFKPDNTLKRCNVCREKKEGWEFNRDMRTADGKSYTCRDCQKKMRLFTKKQK